VIIAQITDLHARPQGQMCNHVVDTNAMLARAVDAISALKPLPDVVLATGDLTDMGQTAEYETLRRELSRLKMPFYLVPGNHDRREGIREVFSDLAYLPKEGRFSYTVEDHAVRLIALDTLIPGETHGEVGSEQRQWLEKQLALQPDRPTVIFMHHPPFPTGIDHMDRINCLDGGDVARVVGMHGQVERVLCGHHHRPIQIRWAGTIGSVAPSTAHQVTLDLAPEGPASFHLEPPAYHLHSFIPGAGIVTHHAYVEAFAGPYPFISHKAKAMA
jgi:3',5'-cyclic AMP phosphodiesterase CpdA